jgi:uncharacterized membrane protein YqgA involved in biofilm formation
VLGNFVNAGAIFVGGLLGIAFNGKVSERFETLILQSMALGVLIIGFQGALKVNNPLIMLLALATGALTGEWMRIEDRLTHLSEWIKVKFSIQSDGFVNGFVSATLLYCVGSMAIVGSLNIGLYDDHSVLIAKGLIDGVISILLGSTLGIGVAFSAVVVFLYQGSIIIGASFLKPFLTDVLIADISVVGSVLIVAIGINMLGLLKIRVGNLLPAILMAAIFSMLLN